MMTSSVCAVERSVGARLAELLEHAVGRDNRLGIEDIEAMAGLSYAEALAALDEMVAAGKVAGNLVDGWWIPFRGDRFGGYRASRARAGGRGGVGPRRDGKGGRPTRVPGSMTPRMRSIWGIVKRCVGRENAISPGALARAARLANVQQLCACVAYHQLHNALPRGFTRERHKGYWYEP